MEVILETEQWWGQFVYLVAVILNFIRNNRFSSQQTYGPVIYIYIYILLFQRTTPFLHISINYNLQEAN